MFDLEKVLDLLEEVEQYDQNATGTLIFGGGADGAIFVDQGCICWAAAAGLSRRLTDLLREETSLPAATLSEVFQECQTSHEPLGEALVRRGLISEEALERALLAHTCESLLHLSQNGRKPSWAPRPSSFAPRHRFPTTELLATLGAAHTGIAERESMPTIDWLAELEAIGAAYLHSDRPIPVAEAGTRPLGVREVASLGRWAQDAIETSRCANENARLVVFSSSSGQAVSAWVEEDLLFVAICPNRLSLSRVISRRGSLPPQG